MKAINNTYDNAALQSVWRNKLVSMLRKFSVSVAMQPLNVHLERVQTVNVPAYSDADNIFLKHDSAKNIASATSIRRLKGLTIHELAHVLYTPRTRSDLGKWIGQNTYYHSAFNILEDSRIENLMVARMSGVKPWLTYIIANEILAEARSPVMMSGVYPLVHGRKYLDPKMLVAARKAYPAHLLPVLEDIVDKYIRITFHDKADTELAKTLIKRFYEEILAQHNTPTTHHGHDNAAPTSGSTKIDNKRAIDKDMKQVEQMAEAQSAQMQSDVDYNFDGSVTSDVLDNVVRSVSDALHEAEAQVNSDVKATREQMTDVSGKGALKQVDSKSDRRLTVKSPRPFAVEYDYPTEVARKTATQFAKHLAEVKSLSDPYWDRRTSSGKLNVRNFIMERNLDEAFDQWDDSQSMSTDIEAVVLLDVSGSMENMLTDAYNSMWSIKRALDSIEASTTVIQYGTFGVELYKADERAGTKLKRTREGNGSTYPLGALRRAHDILTASPRAIKMLLIITDGDWADTEQCEEVILALRSQGVLTGLAFLLDQRGIEENSPLWWVARDPETGDLLVNAHRCEITVDTTDPAKLVDFAKSLADLSRAKLSN
jgi:hypothetical protein